MAGGKLLYNTRGSAQCSVMTRGVGWGGWDRGSKGGDICILWLIHIVVRQKKHSIVEQLFTKKYIKINFFLMDVIQKVTLMAES